MKRALIFLVLPLMVATPLYAQLDVQLQNMPSAAVSPYLNRAKDARKNQDSETEKTILEQGLQAVGPDSTDAFWIYRMLRQYYADRGGRDQTLAMAEKEVLTAPNPSLQVSAMAGTAVIYANMHKHNEALAAYDRLNTLLRQLRNTRGWSNRKDLWQGLAAWAKGYIETRAGHPELAQGAWKSCLSSIQLFTAKPHFLQAECSAELALNFVSQGKLAEAGALMVGQRDLLKKVVDHDDRPGLLVRLAYASAMIAIEQGRFSEAKAIATDAIQQLQALNAPENSSRIANLRLQLAQVAMLENQWATALELHEKRRVALNEGGSKAPNSQLGSLTPDYAYTLYRLGKVTEAASMMESIIKTRSKLYDDSSYFAAESQAFWAVMQAANGHKTEAYSAFTRSVPKLLVAMNAEGSSSETGVLRTSRLTWVLEAYLVLLAEMGVAGDDSAIAEAFRIADLARGSSVQQALSAAATRTIPSDPELARLVRQEQDAHRELSSLTDTIGDLLARGRLAEEDKTTFELRERLAQLRTEYQKILNELERRFPSYSALLNPKPVLPTAIQQSLKEDEALISIFSSRTQTYVWAFRRSGPVAFHVIPIGIQGVADKVSQIRKSFDAATGAIPKFNTVAAHELYRLLLQPVEGGWRGATKLFVVPHASLGELPFAVLLTEPWVEKPSKISFSNLQDAPWLLKEVAISQLPAAMGLPLLRSNRRSSAANAFVGFGDPIFSSGDASERPGSRRNLAIKPAASHVVAQTGIDTGVDFSLLAPLPDTAQEIQEIAVTLQANQAQDTFLQLRATESNVRKQNLSDYRVVMFATHGLAPGELPGMYQPALALSNPDITGEDKAQVDGFLSMDEVLGLQLNADWVVLSACNTASTSGKGNEAISGLGRAFFYAGARSLLVTNWPVETVSARMLTTGIFREQVKHSEQSRAVLLQKSSLELMRKGTPSFSYAHPLFWAPYVLVGDGGY